jgi:hypothetical protein
LFENTIVIEKKGFKVKLALHHQTAFWFKKIDTLLSDVCFETALVECPMQGENRSVKQIFYRKLK